MWRQKTSKLVSFEDLATKPGDWRFVFLTGGLVWLPGDTYQIMIKHPSYIALYNTPRSFCVKKQILNIYIRVLLILLPDLQCTVKLIITEGHICSAADRPACSWVLGISHASPPHIISRSSVWDKGASII